MEDSYGGFPASFVGTADCGLWSREKVEGKG